MEVDRQLPTAIGPYRVTGLLGRGGMGEVLRGHDDRLDRPVALKRVLPDAREPEIALRRFRREARAAARLSHPSIVQVHDWTESGGHHWLVMELVEGRSLDRVIAEGPLPPERALQIGRDVASGLAEAHEAGIVHRDLKTSNILLDTKGCAKILDFGLAKPVRPPARDGVSGGAPPKSSTTLTGEGRIVGTVTAMSPEQALGKKVDYRSDLFSLGILLYEISSGVSPFEGRTPVETLTRVCSAPEEPLHRLVPEIPEDLSRLVSHLLEKDPSRRPGDAHQVVATIERLSSASSPRLELADPEATGSRGTGSRGTGSPGTTVFDLEEGLDPEHARPPDPRSATVSEAPPRRHHRRAAVLVGVAAGVALAAGIGLLAVTGWLESSEETAPGSSDEVGARAVSRAGSDRTPLELYRSGMARLESPDSEGSLDEAIAHFQAALAQDEDYAPALAGLAWAYRLDHFHGSMDRHRLEQALAAAEQAVRINGHLAFARVSLGLVLLEKGELDTAESEFERALELEPSNAEAWTGFGRVQEARGDWQHAEESFRKATDLQPEEVEYLGLLYHRTGRYEEAARAFSQYLELSPDSFRTRSNLGVVFYMQGRLSEAAEQFQKALQIRPDPTLYTNIGTIFFTQGLYARSVVAFEDALRHGGSNHYLLWGNLGDARRWSPGQEEKARDAYLRSLQLLDEELAARPQDPTLRTRRTLYLAKRGDCDGALAEVRQLAGLAAEDGNAWFRMAVALEICSRREDALAALEKALRARFSLEEIRRDPELLSLRTDVRFHRMLSRSQAEEDLR